MLLPLTPVPLYSAVPDNRKLGYSMRVERSTAEQVSRMVQPSCWVCALHDFRTRALTPTRPPCRSKPGLRS